MQLGFNTAILPGLNFEEVCTVARNIGYQCIEVMCWPAGKATRRYAGVTHIDVSDLADNDMDNIQDLLTQNSLQISALGYYPNPLVADREERDLYITHIKKVIEASARLGIGRMNTFIGRNPKMSVDDNWPLFESVWKDIIAFAEDKDVKIGIENCPMLFTYDEWPGGKNLATGPAIWQRMFDAIPSDHFGLNYDPSHMIWQHMDYLSPMREFADKLFHIHAKDVRIDYHELDRVGIMAPPNQWHTPKLPGMGAVDWGQFFSVLTSVGYDGPVCVEVEDRAFEGSPERQKASLVQSYNYLRQYVI